MSDDNLLLVEHIGHVVHVTLNDPKQRNALSNTMIEALISCIEAPAVRNAGAVVLSGAGSDFCAGGNLNDFRELMDASAAEQWEACERFRYLFAALRSFRPILVAAVHGRALGGGCGLAAACDFAIASDDAQFGTPEIRLGAFPMVIVPPLVEAMGVRRTMHMSTTGEPISAGQALDYGLVQKIVAAATLDAEVDQIIERLNKLSASALRIGKATVRSCTEASYSSGLEIGMAMRSIVFSTEEFQAGVDQFLNPAKKN